MLASLPSLGRRRSISQRGVIEPVPIAPHRQSSFMDDSEPPSYNEALSTDYIEPLSIQATFEELSEPLTPWLRKKFSLRTPTKHTKWRHAKLRLGSTTADEEVVTLWKVNAIGIELRSDILGRAFVQSVAVGSPAAAAGVRPYDEILEVAGTRLLSGRPVDMAHALMRDAPAGPVIIRKRSPPDAAVRSALLLQDRWRTVHVRRKRLTRRVLHKSHPSIPLGVTLSADFGHRAVVESTKPMSIAARALSVGDLIHSVNGRLCKSPLEAVQLLREASGSIQVLIWPRFDVVA